MKAGRPEGDNGKRRKYYMAKFGLKYSPKHIAKRLPVKLLDQLDNCASDDHRRLLLGMK